MRLDDLTPKEIVAKAMEKHAFKKLKIDPFDCPACQEHLLIDRCKVRVDSHGFTLMEHLKVIRAGTPRGTSSIGPH